MPLNELAKKVAVSASALSQIENAKAFPSIVTLKSIADGLYTTVDELIGENETLSKNPLMSFEEISFIEENESGTSAYLLTNNGSNKQMDTLLLKFKSGADSKDILTVHSGQTFIFVLKGELEFDLDDKSYLIKTYGSFYFNSNRSHTARNTSNTETQIILVTTPPEG